MMKILVLGHKGMLGHMVCSYLQNRTFQIGLRSETIEIITTDFRYPSNEFGDVIEKFNDERGDYIINCIGIIPQKNNTNNVHYMEVNYMLPKLLADIFYNGKVIHPATDCEFNGDLPIGHYYDKSYPLNANDAYGKSKASASFALKEYQNVIQIRTSIIGPELNSQNSLLEWFRNDQSNDTQGYVNHFWNGITTLEWAKICLLLIRDSYGYTKQFGNILQIGSSPIIKYELLTYINAVYDLHKTIIPINTEKSINKCLKSDWYMKNILEQLKELKRYEKDLKK